MRLVTLLVVLVAAAAALTASIANGAPEANRVIRLTATLGAGHVERSVAPYGEDPSKGDVFVGSDVLRNAVRQFGKPTGAIVGRDRYRLAFESAAVAKATVTATLPGGTISCTGRLNSTKPLSKLRVVSTTGVFAGMQGSCEASDLSNGGTLNVYRLHN